MVTQKEFIDKADIILNKIFNLTDELIEESKKFVKENPEVSMYSLNGMLDRKLDTEIQKVAWIYDIIEGIPSVPTDKKYNKSMTKKIRKALGYTQL